MFKFIFYESKGAVSIQFLGAMALSICIILCMSVIKYIRYDLKIIVHYIFKIYQFIDVKIDNHQFCQSYTHKHIHMLAHTYTQAHKHTHTHIHTPLSMFKILFLFQFGQQLELLAAWRQEFFDQMVFYIFLNSSLALSLSLSLSLSPCLPLFLLSLSLSPPPIPYISLPPSNNPCPFPAPYLTPWIVCVKKYYFAFL